MELEFGEKKIGRLDFETNNFVGSSASNKRKNTYPLDSSGAGGRIGAFRTGGGDAAATAAAARWRARVDRRRLGGKKKQIRVCLGVAVSLAAVVGGCLQLRSVVCTSCRLGVEEARLLVVAMMKGGRGASGLG